MSSDTRQEWDALARRFDGAWFFHLPTWADFVREVSGAGFIADLSFTVTVGTEIAAVCPVMLEAGSDGPQFSMARTALPFPAIKPGLAPGVERRAYTDYLETLAALAEEHGAGLVSIGEKFPAIRPDAPAVIATTLARAGFFDVSQQTQVIDLSKPVEQLWAGVRKGHRSDIKRAKTRCTASIWDESTITTDKFREYQALHAKDAGRVTRSQRSFDIMESWIRDGLAVLAEVALDGRAIAFAVIMNFRGRAYYGSACQDPDHSRLGASHLLQWEVIQWLKAHGSKAYDVGHQYFGPQWHQQPSGKDISIAEFKRGFGGETVNVYAGEYFYSLDALSAVTGRRLEAYGAARRTGGADA